MTILPVRDFPVVLLGLVLAASSAEANPQGGTVVGGQATITQPAPNNVAVKQQSRKAIIDWRSFSIGGGESVLFSQPGPSSVVLNRVIGNDLSSIAGSLSANGIVFLVNPNGVVFTRTAKVDVNGLIATTNDIANSDFMAGKFNFTVPGLPGSGVVNEGTITAAQGGLVGLVAPWVRNDGVIAARLGRISLASGDAFAVDLYGDQLIQFAVPVVPTNDAARPNGALVTNTGTISAKGGTVTLTADTAERIVDQAINTTGLVEASAVREEGGEIVLDGGAGGGVQVAGTLDASGKDTGQTGGTVKVLGANVALNAGARVDVSGTSGGGTALIGGDFHGAGPDRNATTTDIAQGASIDADAITSGMGGQVAVWSDKQTTFNGYVSARGGASSGNGGFVEVSGHQQLDYGGTVDLLAPTGLAGTLRLDPENVTIAATGDAPTLPASGDTTMTGTSDNSVLAVSTLLNALSLGNVTVQTGTSGSQAGDIEVATSIGWNGGNSLTLSAYRNITVDDGVSISNVGSGNLTLRADSTGTGIGAVNFSGTGKWDFSQSTGTVSLYYNPADNPAGSVINSTSYTNPINFNALILAGAARRFSAYMLVNTVYDLQNIQNNPAGTYALGKDIDASVTATWNGGEGFISIGNEFLVSNSFEGVLDGLNHTINGLTVKSGNGFGDAGLFGNVGSDGVIRNVGLTDELVNIASGAGQIGGLVGWNLGTITNSFTTGTVIVAGGTTCCNVGGLVGINQGPITQSFSTADVQGFGSSAIGGQIGGLVGQNSGAGTIMQSYATGTVRDIANGSYVGVIGGLAGTNSSAIIDSYATGTVTNVRTAANITEIGGLVGNNTGTISRSYSTGAVAGLGFPAPGGLVGDMQSGTLINSYWDNQASGQTGSGAGIGENTAQLQSGTLPIGFDPTVWGATSGQYPILKWQVATTPLPTPTQVNFGTAAPPNNTSRPPNLSDVLSEVQGETAHSTVPIVTLSQTLIPAWLINDVESAYGTSPQAIQEMKVIALDAQYAALAQAAYEAGAYAPAGWKVIGNGGGPLDPTGLSATVFQNTATGQVVVSFRGSIGSKTDRDWQTDYALGSGVSINALPEMQDALSFAKSMIQQYGNVTFVGHSLGGAMAQYAAVETGAQAVAFDPAPLANSLGNLPLPIGLPNYQNITNFRGPSDPVTGLTGWADVGPPAIIVKNAPSESPLLGITQSLEYDHSIANLALAMTAVQLAEPALLSSAGGF